MLTTTYYFLQVLICSGIMLLYYAMMLRNKKFHHYNRFYILATIVLSWFIPLIKIIVTTPVAEQQTGLDQVMTMIADNNSAFEKTVADKGFQINWDMVIISTFAFVSLLFVFFLVKGLFRIYYLLKTNGYKNFGEVYLIFTKANGTPFSFFKYIFWNEEIQLQSNTGKQMLQHELIHVKEKHSVDKIIMQIVLIVGWYNPFFWFAKNEMNLIHEFIADKKSVDEGDASSLAEMLLAAAYPQQQYLLANSFFFSPIKRRLLMITNNKNPRFSYVRRLIVLPLLAIVVMLFAFRLQKDEIQKNDAVFNKVQIINENENNNDSLSADKLNEFTEKLNSLKRTRISQNGKLFTYYEQNSDLSKELYPLYKQMSKEQHSRLHIMMDKVPPAKKEIPSMQQIESWKNENAYGMWIDEKHVSNNELNKYTAKDFSLYYASKLYGGAKTGKKYDVQVDLYTNQYFKTSMRKDSLIVIGIRNNNYPIIKDTVPQKKDSVRVKLTGVEYKDKNGNVSQKKDTMMKFVTEYKIPDNSSFSKVLFIVDGVKQDHNIMNEISPNDIDHINVLKGKDAIAKYGDEAKNGVVEIFMKKMQITNNGRILVVGKKIEADLNKRNIESDSLNKKLNSAITDKFLQRNKSIKTYNWYHFPDRTVLDIILKNGSKEIYDINDKASRQTAINKYGNLPTPPAMLRDSIKVTDVILEQVAPNKIFTKTQTPPEFSGGKEAWLKYLQHNLNTDIPVQKGCPTGKYIDTLNFIVNADGSLHNVQSKNNPGYGTKEEAERVLKASPNWKPAIQNGIPVVAKHQITITFVVSED